MTLLLPFMCFQLVLTTIACLVYDFSKIVNFLYK